MTRVVRDPGGYRRNRLLGNHIRVAAVGFPDHVPARARRSGPPDEESSPLSRILAACRRREVFALSLPLVSGLLAVLLHDNDAAVSQLQKIGGQENIIRETFMGIGTAIRNELEKLLQGLSLIHI